MAYDYLRCVVLNVHDGDTIQMDIDQGLNSHQREWIRLVHCYAPELDEPGGIAARDFLKTFCEDREFQVKTYPVGKQGNEKRTFVRYVGDVLFTPAATDGSTTLSDLMVSMGFATRTEPK